MPRVGQGSRRAGLRNESRRRRWGLPHSVDEDKTGSVAMMMKKRGKTETRSKSSRAPVSVCTSRKACSAFGAHLMKKPSAWRAGGNGAGGAL